MPIDPFFGTLLTAGLSALGSGLKGSEANFQPRQSFRGTGADPLKLLMDAIAANKGMGQALTKRAQDGVKLRTTFQAPPGFQTDPALKDPELLNFKGLDLGNIFGSSPTSSADSRSSDPTKVDPTTGALFNRGSEMNPKVGRGGAGLVGGGNNISPNSGASDVRSLGDLMDAITNPLLYKSRTKKGGE